MANPYYTKTNSFVRLTRARAEPVSDEYDLVEDGFDGVNSAIGDLQASADPAWGASLDTRWTRPETSSSSTAYSCTTSPSASGQTLYTGYQITLYDINQDNTGSATLNVGSTDGAVTIQKVKQDGSLTNLEARDLTPNRPARLFYDGTRWILTNPSANVYQPLGSIVGMNTVAGTTYAPVVGDVGKIIKCTSASSVTVTFNNSIFSADNVVHVLRTGSGSVTLAAGGGVTLNKNVTVTYEVNGQNAMASVIFESASTGYVFGDLTPA